MRAGDAGGKSAAATLESAPDPFAHGFLGNFEPNRHIERRVMLLQNTLKTFGLRERAWKPIKHKTITAVQPKPVFDELDNNFIRNQSTLLGGTQPLRGLTTSPDLFRGEELPRGM